MKPMKTRTLVAGALFALALAGGATAVSAGPGGALQGAVKPDSLVTKTHGCHRSCERGPVLRWHRHVGPRCAPVACYPRAPHPNRCWVDGWGVRHCRW
jgi:hypothetical protein